jgi:hypothetical protein
MDRRDALLLRGWCVAALLLVGTARVADAGCNIIPGTSTTFRAALGQTDRPFALPGDFVTLSLNPVCDGASPGFGATAADNVVTVIFTPPSGAADRNNAVILATDCASLEARRQSCAARPDVGTATCVQINGGPEIGMEVFTKDGQRRLRFRFPDTDDLLAGSDDDRTFSGPTTVAVTGPADPLPCALASGPCTSQSGLIACVDDFFPIDGTCDTGTPGATFAHFSALPPPNSYQALCFDPVPPCTGVASEIRFTTDRAGNLLLPMDWRGILVGQGVPVARLLRASSPINAFPGGGEPITIPGNSFLMSFSPEGGLLPPVFDPHSDPTAANEATLFGSVDAPETVLRIARRSPVFQQCGGGAHDGLPCIEPGDCPGGSCGPTTCQACAAGANVGGACHSGADCPSSTCGIGGCATDSDCAPGIECGPSLFDFATRYLADVGPVLIPRFGAGVCQAGTRAGLPCASDADCAADVCVLYRVVAEDPVPLEGLNETAQMYAFVATEGVNGKDLNGDGDATDDVIRLSNRHTGVMQSIGTNGSTGRAVTRVHLPPFSFPAVAVENDVVAFLEPEPLQGYADLNGNGSVFDTLLRVFRLSGGQELAAASTRAVDAAPLINSRSVALSNGRVIFRQTEAAQAHQTTSRLSVGTDGTEADGGADFSTAMSADGRFLAFVSSAQSIGGQFARPDIFVRDRDADRNGRFDEAGGTRTTRVSVASDGSLTNDYSGNPAMSADGRYVAFFSAATNLVPGDTNGVFDIFLHDRDTDANDIFDEPGAIATERVSVSSTGGEANQRSMNPVVSADGRYVAFYSEASNLVADDTNDAPDIFVHDRVTGATVRVSVASDGTQGDHAAQQPAMSANGRWVAFMSAATNLVPGANGQNQIYVRDRDADGNGVYDEPGGATTTLVSVAPDGSASDGQIGSLSPSISADGRFVAFETWAPLTAGDTNNRMDIFVYDRVSGTTTRASTASDGGQGNGNSTNSILSADGRFVAFTSEASNLVPGDTVIGGDGHCGVNLFPSMQFIPENCPDVFVHDQLTGLTSRISLATDDSEPNSSSFLPSISADGRYVAFSSWATNLVPADTNGAPDIFVRGPDPANVAADLTGNGGLDDVVLRVLDATSEQVSTLCPSTAVSVAGDVVAFLRPEASGDAPGCPSGPDLNGDGDATDDVVHLWQPGVGVTNLHCAAVAVAVSSTYAAALVSEAGQGQDLNGDGDQLDDVVMVHRIADGPPASCAGWANTQQAADSLDISGSMVVFLTPESAQGAGGGTDLNGDGDKNDRIVQIWDAAAGSLIPGSQAAEDFVLGSSLLAFRTREAAQGNEDLNGDGDTLDDVLQIYDLNLRERWNTHQAVTPCRLEACDPRVPYRVLNDTVKFLTFEADQGEDLNQNGSGQDLILQTFNVRMAQQQGAGQPLVRLMSAPQRFARTVRRNAAVTAAPHTTLGAVSAGLCTTTGKSCATDTDCMGGTCFVPPGGCIRDIGTACNPTNPASCAAGQFCQPPGTCEQVVNNASGVAGCQGTSDCVAGDVCSDAQQGFERLVDALSDQGSGSVVFTSSGLCIEPVTPTASCSADADCHSGELCGKSGSCQRAQGVCKEQADCPSGSTCTQDLLVATDRDSDGDEIPDRFDNCPDVPNVAQEDSNENGIGDACDLAPTPSSTPTSTPTWTVTPTGTVTATGTRTATVTTTSTRTATGTATATGTSTATAMATSTHTATATGTGTATASATSTRTPTGTVTTTGTTTATATTTSTAAPTSTPDMCGAALSGCRSAAKSMLILGRTGGSTDRLIWKWLKGQSTRADFADPTDTAQYTLCLYAGTTSAAIARAVVAPGPAAWSPIGTKGFLFKDDSAVQDGMQKIVLKDSGPNNAKILVKGEGAHLPDPVLPLALPVTVQLRNSDTGICWAGTYQLGNAKRNDVSHFKAKQ